MYSPLNTLAIKQEGAFRPFALETVFHRLRGIKGVEITISTNRPDLARGRIVSERTVRRKRIAGDFCEVGRHECG